MGTFFNFLATMPKNFFGTILELRGSSGQGVRFNYFGIFLELVGNYLTLEVPKQFKNSSKKNENHSAKSSGKNQKQSVAP